MAIGAPTSSLPIATGTLNGPSTADLPDLAYTLDDYRFGTGTSVIVTDVTVGEVGIISTDSQLPRADGVRFGRDFQSNRTITFEIAIAESPHRDGGKALDVLDTLNDAWSADETRLTPGKVSALRMARNGRVRRCYGRARRFATTSERTKGGWVYATAEFVTVDPNFYADTELNNTVSIIPVQGGGLLAPLEAPLSTLGISYGPGDVIVGGSVACWPIFLINGPIQKPKINVVGEWSATVDIDLAHDEWLVIDSRPWSRGVRKNGTVNVAGRLNSDAPRLSEIRLAPGPHEVVLSGIDPTGTSQMTIAWRNTYKNY